VTSTRTAAGPDTTGPAPLPDSQTAAPRRARWLVAWAPAAAVALLTVVALLATGTPALDVARYAGYLGYAILLPGTLVYRALRGRPRTLVEDLAVGAATGFALELAAWAAYSGAGLAGWLWSWPLLVAVPFAAVPALRRHWWPRGYQPVPAGWAWAVAAVAAAAVGYLTLAYLAMTPITPTGPHPYYQDLLYHLSFAAEAQQHFPLQAPQLAGEPLNYHWFTDAHLATAGLISGVDLPTVLFRLYLVPIAVAAVALLAVAGWRVSGRPWVGPLAAALVFAVGELKLSPGSGTGVGTVFAFTAWASPSMTYSYLFLFPLVMLVAQRLAGRPEPRDRGAWVLIALFLLASAGSKSSTIPVLLAGAGLVLAVGLLRRRIVRPAAAVLGAALAVQVVSSVVLLGGQAYGVAIGPLRTVAELPFAKAALAPERADWKDAALVAAAAALWAVVLFARLAGIPALLARRRWRPDDVELFLLGGFVAGAAAALLLTHPGGGQAYFLKAGWPLGAILSAWGFVELVRDRRPSRRLAYAVAGALAAITVVLVAMAPRLWPPARPVGARAVLVAAEPLLALAAAGAVATAGWLLLRRARPELRGAGAVVALAAVLGAGAANLPLEVRPIIDGLAADRLPATAPTGVSPSMVAAARWVRDHAGPDDIVATNAHCLNQAPDGLRGRPCDARAFWVSGFGERRVLVEGWGYSNRIVGTTPPAGLGYAEQPFWDPELLAANDTAFTDPTPRRLAALRHRYGVRWLVADRRVGVSPELAALATLRHRGPDAEVYELR
jgi:hypothetical protein